MIVTIDTDAQFCLKLKLSDIIAAFAKNLIESNEGVPYGLDQLMWECACTFRNSGRFKDSDEEFIYSSEVEQILTSRAFYHANISFPRVIKQTVQDLVVAHQIKEASNSDKSAHESETRCGYFDNRVEFPVLKMEPAMPSRSELFKFPEGKE